MLSVVVPIYNGELYLEKFINNVLNQTFSDYELILINDGSTDRSKEICEKYVSIDSRIHLVNKQNEGAGPARNKGIELSKGRYIMFIDCDDYFEKNFFGKMYNVISNENVDLVITGQVNVIGNKLFKLVPKYKKYSSCEEIRSNYIELKKQGFSDVLWNKIYDLDIINRNKIRFPDLRRGQDTVFNISYFDKINKCITLDEALYYYRFDNMYNIFNKFPKNHFEVIENENIMIKNTLIKWNAYDKNAEEYLSAHFIKALVGALINVFNPKWNYNLNQKYNNIKSIVNNKCVNEVCNIENISNYITKYENITIFAIKNKMILLLMILSKIKIIIKGILIKFSK